MLLDFHSAHFRGPGGSFREELAVTTTASIANALFGMGQRFGLLTNGLDASVVPLAASTQFISCVVWMRLMRSLGLPTDSCRDCGRRRDDDGGRLRHGSRLLRLESAATGKQTTPRSRAGERNPSAMLAP